MRAGSTSHEWVTVFVVEHYAGSQEGAVHQRNEMDKAICATGAHIEPVMAWTGLRQAKGQDGVGYKVFSMLANEED